MNDRTPSVVAWVKRMLKPKAEGEFEAWSTLAPTLTPFLESQLSRLFLPWSDANAKALASGSEEFSVELDGRVWTQKPQKYHAKSLAALREKYAGVKSAVLDEILDGIEARRWLA